MEAETKMDSPLVALVTSPLARVILTAAILLGLSALPDSMHGQVYDLPTECRYAIVTRVTTPDTILVDLDGTPVTVRYIHTAVPLTTGDYDIALAANRMLMVGQAVCLQEDNVEADDALLRHVWLYDWMDEGPVLAPRLLVETGQLTVKLDPPNTLHVQTLQNAMLRAMGESMGVWRHKCPTEKGEPTGSPFLFASKK